MKMSRVSGKEQTRPTFLTAQPSKLISRSDNEATRSGVNRNEDIDHYIIPVYHIRKCIKKEQHGSNDKS